MNYMEQAFDEKDAEESAANAADPGRKVYQ